MRFRYIILTVFGFCLFFKASGQEMFNINGTVHKKGSPEKVPQVMVTNLRTKTSAMTNVLGEFHIPASIGDTLLFKKFDYTPQIDVIANQFDISVYFQPVTLLQQVNIREQTKKQEINDVMEMYKHQGGYYTLHPSTWSALNSPLTALYEYLGQEPNRARKFQEHTKEELEHIEINKRYNAELVKKITGMTDDKEVKDFIYVFTPAYQDIKTWSDYEVIKYIKTAFDYYKKNKKELLPTLY